MKFFDCLKRSADVFLSSAGLIVTLPLTAATAGVVWATHGRPVLFRQARPGKDGELFELVKFRTMMLADERHVTNEQRLTRVGAFLRTTSLDELPTLWNVLRGHMSLVGPRPLRAEYLAHYSAEQARRHEVRPGVTGLAQVSGRNRLSWEEKFDLDVEYVDNRSMALDMEILLRTVGNVLRRDGITGVGGAFVEPFIGSSQHGGGSA